MSLAGRWFSPRDLKFINSINSELFNDVIQAEILIFKRCPQETKTNMYGETDPSTGNVYYTGVIAVALIEKEDMENININYGPTRKQGSIFKFRRHELEFKKIYPEIGDLISYNAKYYSIDNIIEDQLLGSIPSKSWSIICHSNYVRLSNISLVSKQF
jgi:hypothetical protein